MAEDRSLDRRNFLRQAGAMGAALGAARDALARSTGKASGRVIGANDRINVGVIGVGGRGTDDLKNFSKYGDTSGACRVVAVADCYQKRINRAKDLLKIDDGYLDYREIINRTDIDAVVIATPDHWHSRIALDAMDHGKDVYLEKPMCHSIEEARQLVNTVKETGRVLQVGSQTTSADQWWKAKKAIADGMIGKMVMSQGSYHRNSAEGEWNWAIDQAAGPEASGENYIDWKTWLGPAPKRPFDADRFFRFRKYWDYSGGIATDLFFHVVAPLNVCWDRPQFPSRVVAGGGIYIFKDSREVPDTFHLIADYPEGHSLVLSSTMANSQHIPGLIRGHDATLIIVEHGKFEQLTDALTLRPETHMVSENGERVKKLINPDYQFGMDEQKIPVDKTDMNIAHVANFLDCVRSRQKPHLDVETAACAQVAISMSVESYRQGKTIYFDEKKWKTSDKPMKA